MSLVVKVMALVGALACPVLLTQAQSVPKDWWVGPAFDIEIAYSNNRSDSAFVDALQVLVIQTMTKTEKARHERDMATLKVFATINLVQTRLLRQFAADKKVRLSKGLLDAYNAMDDALVKDLLRAGGTPEDFAKDAAAFREIMKSDPDLVLRPEFATLLVGR